MEGRVVAMPISTRTEKRYSVCIGINKYHPSAGLSTLRYAENDARAMDALFSRLGFEAENRYLLLGEAATLDAVNDALLTTILDKADENDLVVFYFAGHSLPLVINQRQVEEQGAERRSEVFLTTYDFDHQKIRNSLLYRKRNALGMERLRKDFFEGDGSRKRLFIFDSCYSGDFYGGHYRDEADPIQGYIRHMLDSTSTGRVALSSCLPIQKAVEDPALGHGRFTYYVLKALSGEAEEALSRDGCLTVNGLFDYVAKQLPLEQRPVLSGVQQDSFELVCFSDKAMPLHQPTIETEDTEEIRQREKKERLKALIIEQSGFVRDRVASFVGREKELEEIRQRIRELLPTGGYLTITGQAGQGKSSIIAKLVEELGVEMVAFHFIPFNPGPDHQTGLLRNLMARLILEYDLTDHYVASESRSVLREYLPKVLSELTSKGGVFVLGTRPDDTLRPLELLKPHYEYKLPNFSRDDFELILDRHKVHLSKELADRFYKAMQENALYLDLVAWELTEERKIETEEIIQRVSTNPENIFSLSIERLKRQTSLWEKVIYPMLGVLLIAREPLILRHIGQILEIEEYRLRDGLARLGGLITEDGEHRYSLFHLKLYAT